MPSFSRLSTETLPVTMRSAAWSNNCGPTRSSRRRGRWCSRGPTTRVRRWRHCPTCRRSWLSTRCATLWCAGQGKTGRDDQGADRGPHPWPAWRRRAAPARRVVRRQDGLLPFAAHHQGGARDPPHRDPGRRFRDAGGRGPAEGRRPDVPRLVGVAGGRSHGLREEQPGVVEGLLHVSVLRPRVLVRRDGRPHLRQGPRRHRPPGRHHSRGDDNRSLSADLTIGRLPAVPALERPDLLAPVVAGFLRSWPRAADVGVAEIDPDLADTAACCAAYGVALEASANCVVVAGRRGEITTMAACMVLATTRADVNGVVRRRLDARKASFAPMDAAVAETAMEYGGITPVGLPTGWPILVDAAIVAAGAVVIGSGVRRSKLVLPGAALVDLPGGEVVDGLANPG